MPISSRVMFYICFLCNGCDMMITVILSYDGAGLLLSPLREVDIDLSLSSDHMQVHRSRNTPTTLRDPRLRGTEEALFIF